MYCVAVLPSLLAFECNLNTGGGTQGMSCAAESTTTDADLSTLMIWLCDMRFQPLSHDCLLISQFLTISIKNLEDMSKHPYLSPQ